MKINPHITCYKKAFEKPTHAPKPNKAVYSTLQEHSTIADNPKTPEPQTLKPKTPKP